MRDFHFPVGYHHLHRTKIIDYQLNRWHSMGTLSLDTIREAAARIRDLDDFAPVMLALAEGAFEHDRALEGAFLVRAAEFFVAPDDPRKQQLYERFTALFYGDVAAREPFTRHAVDYPGGHMVALDIPALDGRGQPVARGRERGRVVLHGGFDSFLEELYSMATQLARGGRRVILFDGPGQGATLKRHHIPLTHAWEKPAAAILNHFELRDVTWMGVSMGGWLCFRAAAFEPRIRRVVALSVAYDYLAIPPKPVAAFARWMLGHPGLTNRMARLKARLFAQERWGLANLQYITQTASACDAANAFLQLNADNLQSGRVHQDVLILSGSEDHFIPMKLHHMQVAALSSARSVTERIFTPEEHAANHCQVGNLGLALRTVNGWLDNLDASEQKRDQAPPEADRAYTPVARSA